LTIGQALLSPTRSFAPIVKQVLENHLDSVHGIVHCTGGAQTKVLHFLQAGHVVKDNLFDTPPLFKLIQSDTGTEWEEMYKVFNMGNRMEFYCDKGVAEDIIGIADSFGIEARLIGHVTEAETPSVTVKSEHGQFNYQK
jgi:phosphoribosylformylglycinamidine cyclo-ligase